MIVKPVVQPIFTILCNGKKFDNSESAIVTVSSLSPTFEGNCDNLAEDKEIEKEYCFELYKGDSLVETTNWQFHKSGENDIGYFETKLQNQSSYKLKYKIRTMNEYEAESSYINFIAMEASLGDLEHISISLIVKEWDDFAKDYIEQDDKEKVYRAENACIRVFIQSDNADPVSGTFVICRASEKDNYTRYEDMYYINYIEKNLSNQTLCFTDYTIESGIEYVYAIQKINPSNIRTNIPSNSPHAQVDFEYGFLYRDGIQLQLRFNQKMSSFKHTTLRAKQDTLGDKYPHLIQNGNAYYAEFPVSGLISYQGNTDNFFVSKSDGVYYNEELILAAARFDDRDGERGHITDTEIDDKSKPAGMVNNNKDYIHFQGYSRGETYAYENDTYAGEDYRTEPKLVDKYNNGAASKDYSISTNLTDKNIYIERKFREKVEEFLNNFECKLYKSPTEGNIVINLLNVTMQPVEAVGRMLYEFTATAYEIGSTGLESLESLGIIDRGAQEVFSDKETIIDSFGQAKYLPSDEETLWETIRQQESARSVGAYIYELQSITSFWIEQYPQSGLIQLYNENQGDYVNTVPNKYITLSVALDGGSTETILAKTCQIYTLNENITNIEVSSNVPLIINYVCKVALRKDTSLSEVTTIDIKADFGQVIVDNTTDLMAAMKKAIKKQIETDKNVILSPYGDMWRDGQNNEYRINSFTLIDITAAINTVLMIDGQEQVVGNSIYSDTPFGYQSNRIFYIPELGQGTSLILVRPMQTITLNYNYILEIRYVIDVEV